MKDEEWYAVDDEDLEAIDKFILGLIDIEECIEELDTCPTEDEDHTDTDADAPMDTEDAAVHTDMVLAGVGNGDPTATAVEGSITPDGVSRTWGPQLTFWGPFYFYLKRTAHEK